MVIATRERRKFAIIRPDRGVIQILRKVFAKKETPYSGASSAGSLDSLACWNAKVR